MSVTAKPVIFVGIGDVGGSVVGVIDLLGVLLGSPGVIVLDPVLVSLPSSG